MWLFWASTFNVIDVDELFLETSGHFLAICVPNQPSCSPRHPKSSKYLVLKGNPKKPTAPEMFFWTRMSSAFYLSLNNDKEKLSIN